MSINQNTVTVTGNIGNDPTPGRTTSGTPVLNFRIGVSSGYFDRRSGAWVDGDTSWYAVAAYGNLAEHAQASLRRGDPVVIIGRLKIREWEANGRKGVSADIVADTIGHDLNRGTSAFARRQRAAGADAAPPLSGDAPRAADAPDGFGTDTAASDDIPQEHVEAWSTAGMTGPATEQAYERETLDEDDLVDA